MPVEIQRHLWRVTRTFQILAMLAFAGAFAASAAALIAYCTGLSPWPVLLLQVANGGMINVAPVVIGSLFGLSTLLLAYMPANWRVLALENSHRSFRMRMEDVTRAYWVAHQGDREGTFETASEFDLSLIHI